MRRKAMQVPVPLWYFWTMKKLWKVVFITVPWEGTPVEESWELHSKNGVTAIRMAKRRSIVSLSGTLIVTVKEIEESGTKGS